MCTGSFGANEDMMMQFYPEKFARWAVETNAYSCYMDTPPDETLDDGLGHKMMCWLGAQMEDICSYQAWQTHGYMTYPYLQVNGNGERFENESVASLNSAHINVNENGSTSGVWQILPTNDFVMASPFGVEPEMAKIVLDSFGALEGDTYTADTIEELADMIDVPADNLVATVKRYNELCYKGEDADYMKAPRYLDAIDDPPYTAIALRYTFFCTTAGVRCNKNLQVLDGDLAVIPGLYAAGNTVGYRFGSAYQTLIHGMTNSFAITHGYVAGETAALSDPVD